MKFARNDSPIYILGQSQGILKLANFILPTNFANEYSRWKRLYAATPSTPLLSHSLSLCIFYATFSPFPSRSIHFVDFKSTRGYMDVLYVTRKI